MTNNDIDTPYTPRFLMTNNDRHLNMSKTINSLSQTLLETNQLSTQLIVGRTAPIQHIQIFTLIMSRQSPSSDGQTTPNMDVQPQLIDEPTPLLIKPTLMTTIGGMDYEYHASYSEKSLEDLDDSDHAIIVVENLLQQMVQGTINNSDTNAWILNMLHNNAYSNGIKFNVLALVLNQYCQNINARGGGISQAEFDLTSLLIQNINDIWGDKPYELKLGQL